MQTREVRRWGGIVAPSAAWGTFIGTERPGYWPGYWPGYARDARAVASGSAPARNNAGA